MKKLVIERKFRSSIDDVWRAFSTADTLKKWWSPKNMTATFISIDFREGGVFRFCFSDESANEFWGRGLYQTMIEPSFFSYLDTFTDPDGNPVPPSYFGMEGDEIVESLVNFEFANDGEFISMKMTMDDSYDQAMTDEMAKGWNEMFDKLESIL